MSNYKIVRTYSAGVFFGLIDESESVGTDVTMTDARRIWRWSGAASLSQLAMEGVKDPANCKFPIAVNKVKLTSVVEILDCTDSAEASLKAVPVWSA